MIHSNTQTRSRTQLDLNGKAYITVGSQHVGMCAEESLKSARTLASSHGFVKRHDLPAPEEVLGTSYNNIPDQTNFEGPVIQGVPSPRFVRVVRVLEEVNSRLELLISAATHGEVEEGVAEGWGRGAGHTSATDKCQGVDTMLRTASSEETLKEVAGSPKWMLSV